MSDDPVDALTARLFAAARAERPDLGLAGRVVAGAARHTEHASTPPASRARPGRRALGIGLLAAAAGLAFAFGWGWLARSVPTVAISAETVPSGSTHGPLPATRATPDEARAEAADSARRSSSGRDVELRRDDAAERDSANDRQPESVSAASASAEPSARASRRAAPPPAGPSAGAASARAPALPTGSSAAASPAPSRAAAPPVALTEEVELLQRARGALRGGDARGALGLLAPYEGEAPGRALTAEAALLRIEAHAALGERAAARRVANDFLARNPDGFLADRARGLIRGLDAPAGNEPAPGVAP